MSWKWTSGGLGDIPDEDPKALEREFKQEIKQMTPCTLRSRSTDFTVIYKPESGKRLTKDHHISQNECVAFVPLHHHRVH